MKYWIAEIMRSSETFEDIFRIGYQEDGASQVLVQFVGSTESLDALLKTIGRTIDLRNKVIRI